MLGHQSRHLSSRKKIADGEAAEVFDLQLEYYYWFVLPK
jgi:hypothetical protein